MFGLVTFVDVDHRLLDAEARLDFLVDQLKCVEHWPLSSKQAWTALFTTLTQARQANLWLGSKAKQVTGGRRTQSYFARC